MSTSNQSSEFVCLTCGRSLDKATSKCPCGGRATRRSRTESEVMNEDNKKLKTLWRFQKLYYVVLIIYAITLIIGMLLIKSNEILSVIIMVIGFIITPILYFVASFRYHKCPYCYHLFNVRKLYDEEFCPYCGKRIKPIKSQLK